MTQKERYNIKMAPAPPREALHALEGSSTGSVEGAGDASGVPGVVGVASVGVPPVGSDSVGVVPVGVPPVGVVIGDGVGSGGVVSSIGGLEGVAEISLSSITVGETDGWPD